MKIAVIGGGTAGYMAAAHITKYFPKHKLYHIYDPNIPNIGVGEGTLVGFTNWLREITLLSYSELEKKCYITRKYGILFENWGVEYEKFFHHFYPVGENFGYHISAPKIVELLQDYISATTIHKKIVDLKSDGLSVNISFEDSTNLEVDLAVDASGFPKSLSDEHIKLSLIPTNAALIRQRPTKEQKIVDVKIEAKELQYVSATRSVARPYGWIFVIPLTFRIAYGYIYNRDINTVSEIEQDFDKFLASEGITCEGGDKHLKFPNYCQKTFFDGSLYKMGNAASFLEPLEATAIGVIHEQILLLSRWVLPHFAGLEKRKRFNEHDLQVFNNYMRKYVERLSLFVGWHYVKGSPFNTEFWQYATSNFNNNYKNVGDKQLQDKFEKYLHEAAKLPHPFKKHEEFCNVTSDLTSDFGQFPVLSFAEVGHGNGYFS